MLLIRDAQMRAFKEARLDSFRQRLRNHLAGRSTTPFPSNVYDQQFNGFLALATESGFTTEENCAALAELVYRISGAFDIEGLSLASQNVIYEYKVTPQIKLASLQRLHGFGPDQE